MTFADFETQVHVLSESSIAAKDSKCWIQSSGNAMNKTVNLNLARLKHDEIVGTELPAAVSWKCLKFLFLSAVLCTSIIRGCKFFNCFTVFILAT